MHATVRQYIPFVHNSIWKTCFLISNLLLLVRLWDCKPWRRSRSSWRRWRALLHRETAPGTPTHLQWWQGSGTLHCTLRPRQPSARWTRLVSALAVVQDTTQRIRRCRGVSLRTTTPWRRSLQRYRHPSTWLAVSEYDAIPSTESEWVSECVDLYSA